MEYTPHAFGENYSNLYPDFAFVLSPQADFTGLNDVMPIYNHRSDMEQEASVPTRTFNAFLNGVLKLIENAKGVSVDSDSFCKRKLNRNGRLFLRSRRLGYAYIPSAAEEYNSCVSVKYANRPGVLKTKTLRFVSTKLSGVPHSYYQEPAYKGGDETDGLDNLPEVWYHFLITPFSPIYTSTNGTIVEHARECLNFWSKGDMRAVLTVIKQQDKFAARLIFHSLDSYCPARLPYYLLHAKSVYHFPPPKLVKPHKYNREDPFSPLHVTYTGMRSMMRRGVDCLPLYKKGVRHPLLKIWASTPEKGAKLADTDLWYEGPGLSSFGQILVACLLRGQLDDAHMVFLAVKCIVVNEQDAFRTAAAFLRLDHKPEVFLDGLKAAVTEYNGQRNADLENFLIVMPQPLIQKLEAFIDTYKPEMQEDATLTPELINELYSHTTFRALCDSLILRERGSSGKRERGAKSDGSKRISDASVELLRKSVMGLPIGTLPSLEIIMVGIPCPFADFLPVFHNLWFSNIVRSAEYFIESRCICLPVAYTYGQFDASAIEFMRCVREVVFTASKKCTEVLKTLGGGSQIVLPQLSDAESQAANLLISVMSRTVPEESKRPTVTYSAQAIASQNHKQHQGVIDKCASYLTAVIRDLQSITPETVQRIYNMLADAGVETPMVVAYEIVQDVCRKMGTPAQVAVDRLLQNPKDAFVLAIAKRAKATSRK